MTTSALQPRTLLLYALVLGLLTGCETTGYYAQAVSGHFDVMGRRQSIRELLDDPRTPQELQRRLRRIERIRAFAAQELDLPAGDSYRQYADLERPYVAWNVFAAPEFSLVPINWCFPIAGCVAYRGYFSQQGARDYADRLAAQGNDTFVGGVTAYSTLGWFDDPVLNTFFSGPPWTTAGLVFHELAHRKLYVAGDSTFNESFAVVVEREGVRRWLQANGDREALQQARRIWRADDLRRARIEVTSTQLRELYRKGWDKEHTHREKRRILDRLNAGLRGQRNPQKTDTRQGQATAPLEINNAVIAAIGTYHAYVPGFEALLANANGDLGAFYEQAKALAALPRTQRHARLSPSRQYATERALTHGKTVEGRASPVPLTQHGLISSGNNILVIVTVQPLPVIPGVRPSWPQQASQTPALPGGE